MERPRITLVTPSLNQVRFVERTVASVLGQRYPRLEYIVMDGGSTDGTLEILKRYRRHFAHIESTPDDGPAPALQRGFHRATGEIMGWVNSYDMLAPETLEFVAWYFAAHPRIDMIYSHRVMIDAADRAVGYWLLPRHSNRKMRRWPRIPQETCFWRRGLYERAGGIDAKYRFAMDFDLFARFMMIGRVDRVDRFLGASRLNPSSTSTRKRTVEGGVEIDRIRAEHGLVPRPWWPLLAHRFERGMEWRGQRFADEERVLPGCLPGLGWSYDRLWGGTLVSPREGGSS